MRRQLVLMALAITSMVVIAFVVPLGFLVRAIAYDRAVDAANADAQALGPVLAVASDRADMEQIVDSASTPGNGSTSVYLADGSVLGDRSRPAGRAELALARQGRTFTRDAAGSIDVYMPIVGPSGTAVVRIHVPASETRRGVAPAWWGLGTLGVLLLVIAAFVADRIARSITRPLGALTVMARRLGAGDLDARAQITGSPEVVEVSNALDTLATRIGDLLRGERERAADLSHRLRTPLTELRLDAEQLPDTPEAQRIRGVIDRLERAVTAVIADTRTESRPNEAEATEITTVVRERVAFWSVLAASQGRDLRIEVTAPPVAVATTRRDLETAVDVVLGNVLRHTRAPVSARVRVEMASTGGALVVVDDSGPGFGDLSVVSRGVTGADGHGTGLGLDIAARIARASGGSLQVGASDLGGARVTVHFGPVAANATPLPVRAPPTA